MCLRPLTSEGARVAVTEFENVLDELYGVDLDEFTATRKRLAQELRVAGEKDEGAAVAALRKPVVSAWALNQLTRRERRDVDLLLAAGHRLRQAQSSLLRGGGRDEFDSARNAEEAAIGRLAEAARVLLDAERGGASSSAVAQIGATLRAAAVSDEGRTLLARGRFEAPIASEGFEILGALAPAGAPRPEMRKEDDGRAEAIRRAKAALQEAQEAERQRKREAQEAERTAVGLRQEWEQAEQRAEAAREDSEAAARATAAAQQLVDEAQGRSSS